MQQQSTHPQKVFLFIPNLIGYLRAGLLLIFLLIARSKWPLALVCYSVSTLLDCVDGEIARRLGQCSIFGAMLDMIVDRCAGTCLCGAIASLFPNIGLLFILWTAIDFASHWMHLHSCTLTGIGSHKDDKSFADPILKSYYAEKKIMVPLAFGTEIFLLAVYSLAFTQGSLYHSILVTATMTFPLFVAKIVVNLIQIKEASIRLIRSQYRASSTSIFIDKDL